MCNALLWQQGEGKRKEGGRKEEGLKTPHLISSRTRKREREGGREGERESGVNGEGDSAVTN